MTSTGTRADVGQDLADLVGGAHVRTGGAAEAVNGRAPRWVASPGSVDEVSRVLGFASTRGLAVTPTGGGTRLGWGQVPRALDVLLSLRRLDRILAYEPADLTISVEAGVTLGGLNALVRGEQQRLPLDPPRASEATVGGLIATAASGPYRARYGTMRELLLGLTVVRADGAVVKGGGRVVKNATGYDMPKLFVGALGTLGVVVAAHLRLHPLPVAEESWLFGFTRTEAALEAALGISDAPVVVSRLQLLNEVALRNLDDEPGASQAGLGVTIGSVPEGVRAQAARVAEICARHGGTAVPLGPADAWWRRVAEIAWPADPDRDLTLRVGSRPSDVVAALRVIEAAAGDAMVVASAEVASGVLHAKLGARPEGRPGSRGHDDAAGCLSRVREGLRPFHGTCVVEHAPAHLKAGLDVWGDVGPALDLMRRLKSELDPRAILSPGRFVGGI